jgi:hypothetical protein
MASKCILLFFQDLSDKNVMIKWKYVMPEVNWLLALFVVLGTFEK